MSIIYWLILIALLVIFIVLFYILYQKYLEEKDLRMNELLNTLNFLENQFVFEDRRRALRVKLTNQEICHFQLIQFGDPTLNHLLNKRGEGFVYDLSRMGLSMSCKFDLPVRKQIYLNIQFEILGESFNLQGVIRRKSEERNDRIQYGVNFLNMSFMEKRQLTEILKCYERNRMRRA